jgi:hypothetical protein
MPEKEVKADGEDKNSACASSEPRAQTFQPDINVQVELPDLFPKPSAQGCLQLDYSDKQVLHENSSPRKDSPVQSPAQVHLPAKTQPHLLSTSRSKKIVIDSAVLRDRIEKLRQAASKICMVCKHSPG